MRRDLHWLWPITGLMCSISVLCAAMAVGDEPRTLSDIVVRAILPGPASAGSKDTDRLKKEMERAREEANRQQEQERERAKKQQEASRESSKPDERVQGDTVNKTEKESDSSKEPRPNDDKRTGDTRSRDDKAAEEKVPDTVAGVLKRMFGQPDANPTATAAPAAKTRPNAPVVSNGLAIPGVPRPELLALKLSKQDTARAVALGFKANGSAGVSGLDLVATRLLAPDGMAADQARALLRRALPNQGVEVNQKYRIFRTATGTNSEPEAQSRRAANPMATPCGTDRCFGASVINWQPEMERCANALKIGVIDTGYDRTHPAFRGRKIDFRKPPDSGRTRAPDWHGTGVLALLAGESQSTTPGLVPNAHFHVADIFYADTDGQPASDTASLLQALDWLDKSGVAIVSMSLAGPPDELLRAAIAGLSKKGIVFVAAAGNEGPSAPPAYPAAYDPVVAVTAVGKDLKSYRHANRGHHIDIAAPGVDVWTALPGGKSGYHSGTSFAVPYVTAVLAAVYRSLPAKSKASFLEHATVTDLGAPGRDPIYGRGLILAPANCGVGPGPFAPAPFATSSIPTAPAGAMALRALPSR
jgi:hypothetical protein